MLIETNIYSPYMHESYKNINSLIFIILRDFRGHLVFVEFQCYYILCCLNLYDYNKFIVSTAIVM